MNEYGLDVNYFKNKLSLLVRDIDCYKPEELYRELSRLANVVASQAQQPTVTDEMIAAAEAVEDLYRRGTPYTWKKVFLAMWREMPSLQSQAQQAPEYTFDQLTKLLMQAATKEGHKVTMKIKWAQPPAPEGEKP